MSHNFGNSSGDGAADRRFEYGREMAVRGDHAAAGDLFTQGLAITPFWPPLHFHLGEALRLSGQAAQAITVFQGYLVLDPKDHMGAAVKLSLLGEGAPSALPASYVQGLFDEYAAHFDTSLVTNLDYKGPQQIAAALEIAAPGRIFNNMLDLGCGTGLAAQEMSNICIRKTGIDLSPAMVRQAQRKNLYDALHVGSLESFLTQSTESYDLVLCADVFVYIGALETIFQGVASVMDQGGLFAFSVQSIDTGDWTLGPDHRYAHSKEYIERCTTAAGLIIVSCDKVILRQDGLKGIEGLIISCLKIPLQKA